MRYCDGRKSTRQDEHRTKKQSEWRDYFDWMVQYAGRIVGPNDARSVANDALFDAYRSDRPKPKIDNEKEVRRWLSCLIHWRAMAHRQREKRQQSRALFDFDAPVDLERFGAVEPADDVENRIEIMRAFAAADLSSEERTLLIAYYVGGFSAGELAGRQALNESTVRTRIARATAKVVTAWQERQRKSHRLWGMFFFMEPVDVRRILRKWSDGVREWSANVLRLARATGTSAASVALIGVMPGEGAVFQGFVADPESTPAFVEPAPMTWPWGFSVAMLDVVAFRDKPAPVVTQVMLAENRHEQAPTSIAAPRVISIPTNDVPLDLGMSMPDPYARTQNSEEACHHAYAQAQTAFNVRHDARACLRHLDRIAAGNAQCTETQERKLLREACRAKSMP